MVFNNGLSICYLYQNIYGVGIGAFSTKTYTLTLPIAQTTCHTIGTSDYGNINIGITYQGSTIDVYVRNVNQESTAHPVYFNVVTIGF